MPRKGEGAPFLQFQNLFNPLLTCPNIEIYKKSEDNSSKIESQSWYFSYIRLHKSKAEDQYFPYARPQENGYKTDVKWAKLSNTKGREVKISSSTPFGTSVMPYAKEDFDDGERKDQRQTTDVEKKPFVEWHIDKEQIGIGGDTSWGAKPHQEYQIFPGLHEFDFVISLL